MLFTSEFDRINSSWGMLDIKRVKKQENQVGFFFYYFICLIKNVKITKNLVYCSNAKKNVNLKTILECFLNFLRDMHNELEMKKITHFEIRNAYRNNFYPYIRLFISGYIR